MIQKAQRSAKIAKIAIAILIASLIPQGAAAQESGTQKAFLELFHDFTGIHDKSKTTIAQQLSDALEARDHMGADGPLILVIESGIYVYEAGSRKLAAKVNLRSAAANTGFIELTSVSHIGPAISYLANLKELGYSNWQESARKLLADIDSVQACNSSPGENWLDNCKEQAMYIHKDATRNMVDYGCRMSRSYLQGVLDSNGQSFSANDVSNNLFNAKSDKFPIPFKNVMVGTFALVALNDYFSAYKTLANAKINWQKAKVLMQFHAGTNYSGGLSKDNNHLYKFLRLVSNNELPEDRIFFTPFAELRKSVGDPVLPAEDFDYYSQGVWYHHYARPRVALSGAFKAVDSIFVPNRPELPGDYEYSSADKIDDFMMRMKYSLCNNTELLSNTVGFWVSGELQSKGWKPEKVDIPGLTHGFPKNIKGYPSLKPN